MSSKYISEEDKKKYEKEFLNFLIEKISHAGGSLQFQHLVGILQQVRYEVREMFGTTKPQLMKFLRAHPNTFKIDAKGIIVLVSSPAYNDDSNLDIEEKVTNTKTNKELFPKIVKGIGTVHKILPEYGLIKSREPIETYVYFTPADCGANKDSIFMDLDFYERNEVCFNADYGHDGNEIEYRATKVWRESKPKETDENSLDSCRNRRQSDKFRDKNIRSVYHAEKETAVFDKQRNRECNKNSKTQKQVANISETQKQIVKIPETRKQVVKIPETQREVVKKVEREYNQSSHSGAKTKNAAPMKRLSNRENRLLENQKGRIYPHSCGGAILKFGKDYLETADGDSSAYFYYGQKICDDLHLEFEEGQDVFFDVIPTKKAPGWKAVLVWIGDKPNYTAKVCTEENDENVQNADQDDTPIFHAPSKHSASSVKSGTVKSKPRMFNTEPVSKRTSMSSDRSVYKNSAKSNGNYKQDNLQYLKSKSNAKHKQDNLQYSKSNLQRNPQNTSRSKTRYDSRKGNFPVNKYKSASQRPTEELTESSSFDYEDDECSSKEISRYSSRETMSDVNLSKNNKEYSDDDNEFDNTLCHTKNISKENMNAQCARSFGFKFKSSSDELQSDTESIEIAPESAVTHVTRSKASIRHFKDTEGKLTRVHCKCASVKCPCLSTLINFMWNTFYLNGVLIEDLDISDLKEVLKVGDSVKLNCFEIIDDMGDSYTKVTLCWKGRKPEVSEEEMTPEKFIEEEGLEVTLGDEVEDKDSENNRNTNSFLTTVKNTNSGYTFNPQSEDESPSSDLSEEINDASEDNMPAVRSNMSYTSEDVSEGDVLEYTAETSKDEDFSVNVQYKLLSEKIIQRLKRNGFISSDQKVNLDTAINEVSLVLKNSAEGLVPLSKEASLDSCLNSSAEVLCSDCSKGRTSLTQKRTTDTEVQTIVTGDIVATRGRISIMKKKTQKQ